MAGTSRRQLVDVDEETLVGITGIVGEEAVVDRLLGAVTLVAGSKGAASSLREQTSLQTGRLGVVVNVVDNDTPLALHIQGTLGHGIDDVRGADVTLGTTPVGGVVGRVPSGGTSVVGVVEGLFLLLGHHVDQVISRLVSHISVLLGEEMISTDGTLDLILGVLSVLQAVGEGGVDCAGRGGCGVTIFVLVAWLVTVGGLGVVGRLVTISRGMDGADSSSGTRQNYQLQSQRNK